MRQTASTGSWCSSEFLKSLGLKINFRAKHCHLKKSGGGSQRFFPLDDETVLQKTVGQATVASPTRYFPLECVPRGKQRCQHRLSGQDLYLS